MRYNSTRNAWEDIWGSASVDIELKSALSARTQETIRLYEPYLPKDRPILEAGSGLSAIVVTLRRRGFDVIGMDYALNALHTSRNFDNSLALAGGDVHALPFADGAFGAYLSFGVLEHFEHGMDPALYEAHRVLGPGGVLVLTIPYPNAVQTALRLKREWTGEDALNDDEFYESTYTQHDLVRTVRWAGFRPLLAQPISHAYTLWGVGGPFRARGYYETSRLAESAGAALKKHLPWAFAHMTLVVARKV